ncbi:MAG: XRE family transcriptional regulator, partial [Methylovulum sp.]|nr:XRE family transcriptional regulator [Methylovulum sp.]
MNNDDMELVRGSGNVYRDFDRPNAGLEQARAIVAAKIIGILDDRKLSTRDAEKQTGVSHSEFSRIRNRTTKYFWNICVSIIGTICRNRCCQRQRCTPSKCLPILITAY